METPPPPPPLPPAPPTPPSGPSEHQWKVILHLMGLAGLVLPFGGNVIGPLVIWLIKKDDFPALDAEGRKVLNFQISYFIYFLIASGSFFLPLGCLATPLIGVVVLAWLVFTILGAVKVSNGESIEFPLTIKML